MATEQPTRAIPLSPGLRAEQIFPRLTATQIGRVAAHGNVRAVDEGEVLIEAGRQVVPFFVCHGRTDRDRASPSRSR